MRGTVGAAGVVLAAIGSVWIGQGLGYIKGSFMTGAVLWAYLGVAVLVVGLSLLYGAMRGRRSSS